MLYWDLAVAPVVTKFTSKLRVFDKVTFLAAVRTLTFLRGTINVAWTELAVFGKAFLC